MTCTQDDILTAEKKAFLVNTVLPQAITYLQSALKGLRLNQPLSVGTSPPCRGRVTSPASHNDPGVASADFLLYVSAGAIASSSTVAWATTCSLSSSQRPLVGHANFAPAKLVSTKLVSTSVKVAIHEI